MADQPTSTWTALAYPIAAVETLHLAPSMEATVFTVLMLILGLGTWAFHMKWTPLTSDLDHIGMVGLLIGLGTMAAGAPWWMAALGAGTGAWALVLWKDLYSHGLIGALLWFTFAGLVGEGEWLYLSFGIVALAGGFAIWNLKTDRAHGFWHVATAGGLTLLALAVL